MRCRKWKKILSKVYNTKFTENHNISHFTTAPRTINVKSVLLYKNGVIFSRAPTITRLWYSLQSFNLVHQMSVTCHLYMYIHIFSPNNVSLVIVNRSDSFAQHHTKKSESIPVTMCTMNSVSYHIRYMHT